MLWGKQCQYYFEHELISWFKKAGLQNVESEIIEHNIPYPREYRIGGIGRDNSRLKQIEPYAKRAKMEEEFHESLENLEKYGEEWLPTLLVAGTKVAKSDYH